MIKKSPVLKQGFSIVGLDLTFKNKFKKSNDVQNSFNKDRIKDGEKCCVFKKIGLVNTWI